MKGAPAQPTRAERNDTWRSDIQLEEPPLRVRAERDAMATRRQLSALQGRITTLSLSAGPITTLLQSPLCSSPSSNVANVQGCPGSRPTLPAPTRERTHSVCSPTAMLAITSPSAPGTGCRQSARQHSRASGDHSSCFTRICAQKSEDAHKSRTLLARIKNSCRSCSGATLR